MLKQTGINGLWTIPVMSLRKRIEKSEFLAARIAWLAGLYLSFCHRTTKWQVEGLEELHQVLDDGPVLLVMWHGRSVMAALHWPIDTAPMSSLYDASPVGRVSGALQRRVGMHPMEMARKKSNRAASREILKRVKDGVSIGMTNDGPLGPALTVKDAPLEWARATGMPIVSYAFATTRHRVLRTWDSMVIPRPFGRGAIVFQRFDGSVARQMDEAAVEQLRNDIAAFTDATTARADAIADRQANR